MKQEATGDGKSRYGHMKQLGWEELKAYWRQGLAEMRAAVMPDSNIAQPPDPAMWGMVSQGEAADKRSLEGEPRSVLERAKHAEPSGETRARQGSELEME